MGAWESCVAPLGVLDVAVPLALLLTRRLVQRLDEAPGLRTAASGALSLLATSSGDAGGTARRHRPEPALSAHLEPEAVTGLSHRLRTPLTSRRSDLEALPAGPLSNELDNDHSAFLTTAVVADQSATGAAPVADMIGVIDNPRQYLRRCGSTRVAASSSEPAGPRGRQYLLCETNDPANVSWFSASRRLRRRTEFSSPAVAIDAHNRDPVQQVLQRLFELGLGLI